MADSLGPSCKRPRTDSTLPQQLSDTISGFSILLTQHNPIDVPSPLGLKLKKSPSLLDLIETRLSKPNASFSSELEKSPQSDSEAADSSDIDELNASKFPASLLKIGSWEYKSRYDNDLVGKCYFAKRQFVWEILEGGVKSKIEIQWSDIMALKASFADDEPGTLIVMLGQPPLFFKETNLPTRKHTLWHATTDFTDGQASLYRQHFLQCPPGFLDKHFDELIQRDKHLNMLSQQQDIILDSLYFEKHGFTLEETKKSRGYGFDKGSDLFGFEDAPLPAASQSSSLIIEQQDFASSLNGSDLFCFEDVPLPAASQSSSLIVEQQDFASSLNGYWKATYPKVIDSTVPRNWKEVKVPGLQPHNHLEHCMSDKITAVNTQFAEEGPEWRDVLEDMTEYLLSDSQFTTASDEKSLLSSIDSLCNLLQKDPISVQSLQANVETCFKGSDGNIQHSHVELQDASSSKQACSMLSKFFW